MSSVTLRVEQLEDHIVPSTVVYGNTFNWNGVASVVETVTFDAPGHAGQYLWTFHVTNQSFGSGMAAFAVPAEEAGMVYGLGNNVGWTGSVGTLLDDPDLVAWQGGPPIGVGGAADFWFTTIPVDIALTNGIISNPALTTFPAGLLAVPMAAPVPPSPPTPPVAPLPTTILVTTSADKFDSNTGKTSLREAIDWIERQNLPNQKLQVKFTSGLNGEIILLRDLGQLVITKNIFINGADRNITVERDNTQEDEFRLIDGSATSKMEIAGLTFKNGRTPDEGGAIRALGDLTLEDCWVDNNFAAAKGGGVYCGGALTVKGCVIWENESVSMGGGLYAAGPLTVEALQTPQGLNGAVVKNKALRGAGIYAAAFEVNITNIAIYFNEDGLAMVDPGTGWGGIYIGDHVTKADITGAQIYSNRVGGEGGGIYVAGGTAGIATVVTLRECQLSSNEAQNGGGVAMMKDTLSVVSTSIYGNKANIGETSLGGGVYLGDEVAAASFSASTIAGNTANTSGGGLYVSVPETGINPAVTLDDTWVIGNTAAMIGGGICVGWEQGSGNPQLVFKGNSLVASNTLTSANSLGGGLFVVGGSVTFDGVNFDSNSAGFATGFYVVSGTQVNGWPAGATVNNDSWFIEP